jgi:hypothetical protein
MNLLSREPERRASLGTAAYRRLRTEFAMDSGADLLAVRFRALLEREAQVTRVAAE